jgi:hypothetical protein
VKATLAIGYTFHDLVFTYDPIGNLKSLENKAAPPSTFPGPGLGKPSAVPGSSVTQFAYDTWNRLQTIVYPDQPDGEPVTYFYDDGGLVNRRPRQ